jgi:myosin protein heavy chain
MCDTLDGLTQEMELERQVIDVDSTDITNTTEQTVNESFVEYIDKTQALLSSFNDELDSCKADIDNTNQHLKRVVGQCNIAFRNVRRERYCDTAKALKRDQELQGELESLKKELDDTKKELDDTKKELVATKGDLATTKKELAATKGDLAATKGDLAATKGDLVATKSDLVATKKEFVTFKTAYTSYIVSTTDILKKELNSLKKEFKNNVERLTTENASMKDELEAMKKARAQEDYRGGQTQTTIVLPSIQWCLERSENISLPPKKRFCRNADIEY